ncbi:MAG TPA: AraC family transcriptional regulator [Steroidobacter sp.]|nr:AraC family transcriptional regulator [Steroidobacter sp.]
MNTSPHESIAHRATPAQANIAGFVKESLPLHPAARGLGTYIRLPSGLHIGHERYDVLSEFGEINQCEHASQLQLHMRLSGRSRIDARGMSKTDIEPSTFSAFIHPRGATKKHLFRGNQRYESITILCDAQTVSRLLAFDTGPQPSPIIRFAEGYDPDFYLTSMPMPAAMAIAARALMDCASDSSARVLYLESKALELVSHSLAALQSAAGGSRHGAALSARDLRRIKQAHELVRANYIKPYSIRELARMVGLNEPKLCTAFKAVYGMTIYDFTLQLRMHHALTLLRQTSTSITEIAFEVGYDYPSNFATAFKKVIGISPTAARAASDADCRRDL